MGVGKSKSKLLPVDLKYFHIRNVKSYIQCCYVSEEEMPSKVGRERRSCCYLFW